MTTKRTVKKSKVITCHNCTFYNTSFSLVLCDYWSEHKDEQVLLEASGGKDVDLKIIPPKTTNTHILWTYISSGNIKYMPRE